MPTVISHVAVPLALGLGMGRRSVPAPLLVAGVIASALPDLDVLAFRFGIPYSNEFGHRGASHSLAFAALLGVIAVVLASRLRVSRLAAFLFVGVSAASHGLLDMLTNGGRGVALWWPVAHARYFFPIRVVEVSPLSLHRLMTGHGMGVLQSELLWVWLPAAVLFAALRVWHRWLEVNFEVQHRQDRARASLGVLKPNLSLGRLFNWLAIQEQ
jgi:inner membrane protein